MKSNDKLIQYSIIYLHNCGKSIQEISTELSIKDSVVSSFLEQQNKETKNKNIKTTSSKVNSKDLMITETSSKKINSVAIMTKAASEVNDEIKKKNDKSSLDSRISKNAIYRPNLKKK